MPLAPPRRSVQAAADLAARTGAAVVLRGGSHYLEETLHLGPQHSGLTLTAYPGDGPTVAPRSDSPKGSQKK